MNPRWPSRTVIATVLAGLLMALAGCGGGGASDRGGQPGGAGAEDGGAPSGTAPAGDSGANPCSLLTEAEVAAVGTTVDRVEGPVPDLNGSTCTWVYAGSASGLDMVAVTVWQGLEHYPTEEKTNVHGFEDEYEPVAGIADAALRVRSYSGICSMLFRKGERVVHVLVGGGDEDACVDLARIAADRA